MALENKGKHTKFFSHLRGDGDGAAEPGLRSDSTVALARMRSMGFVTALTGAGGCSKELLTRAQGGWRAISGFRDPGARFVGKRYLDAAVAGWTVEAWIPWSVRVL